MLPQVQVLAGMYCAASPHDTRQQRAGAWQGLALAPLLRAAAPSGAASGVAVAADGARVALPLSWLERGLLATHIAGSPLTLQDGAPARLIIPGLSACMNLRWIERIELSTSPAPPPLLARSFTTLAAQQADDGFVLGGTAFCGAEGLRGVAVRVDDGPALELALTAPSLGFVRWSIGWRPPGAGRWRISAAVVDGGGAEQRMQHVRSLFAPPGHGSLIVEVA